MAFNLQINDYSIGELEDLLDLTFPYTADDIKKSVSRLQSSILSDGTLSTCYKKKVNTFINAAVKKLRSEDMLSHMNTSNIIETGGNIIIKKEPIPNAGTLNPYKIGDGENQISYTVNIDTVFRNNYFSTKASDFHVTLPTTIKNVVSMELVALELPQTIYAISHQLKNNFFSLRWDSSGGTQEANIILRDGNYQPCSGDVCTADLQDELNFQLEKAASGQVQAFVDKRTKKVSIGLSASDSSLTNLMLFFNRDICGNNVSEESLQLKLGWLMGFRFGQYFGAKGYTTEGIFNFRGPPYLFLCVNDFNNNHPENMISVYNTSLSKPENILARFTWLQYAVFATENQDINNVSNKRHYFGPVDINKLHISIIDQYGRVISLNNMDYSLALQFQCLYKT